MYVALNRVYQTGFANHTTNTTLYDAAGRVAYTVDARGTTNAFGYDAAGRRIAVTNAWGITGLQMVTTYAYDANGNQTNMMDALTNKTSYFYDALNRTTNTTFPDTTTQLTAYDAAGRKIAQTDQATNTTWFGYDGAGRLTSVTNALGKVTQYAYDEAGNQTNQVDALSRTNAYVYDGLGRRTQHLMPGGQSEAFGYDPNGNLLTHTNFNGLVITNQYDVMNRLTSLWTNGVSLEQYAYDADGRLTNRTDLSGNYSWVYDSRSRLKTNTTPVGTLYYTYDANGNQASLTSATTAGVNLTYSYDALNRLTNVVDNGLSGTKNTVYTYDGVGNLQTLKYPNGVTNLYQYNSLNRLTNLTWKLNTTALASFYYQLATAGNRTNLTETITGTNRTYAWGYDNLYRLTNETISVTAPTGTIGYAFDAVGNRTNRSSTVSGIGAQTLIYGTNDWLTNTDSYDSDGNTTNSASVGYKYDYADRLTNAGNGAVVITYGADGNRTKKLASGVTTLYLVSTENPTGYPQVVEEFTVDGTTNLSKVYTYGLNLISQRAPSTSTNFFGMDGHGSTRFLTDAGGNVANVFVFDAYGNLIASNTTAQTAYLYTCQQFDSSLSFYYLRARLDNPNTGRFWTMDTYEGDQEDPLSLHKYLFAGANPVNLYDPLGLAASSTSGNNAYIDFGNAVEDKIMQDFRDRFGRFAVTDKSILTSLGLLGKMQLLKQALPDLVNTQQKSFFEIKPCKPRKILEGTVKLAGYWVTFNALDPKGGWHPGSMDEYIPPLEITVSVPPFFAIVTPPVLGLITYTSLHNFAKNETKTLATEEDADLEDTDDIATTDSLMGAP